MNLSEARARSQEQYSRLVKMNQELINALLKYAAATNEWHQPLSAGKTLKEHLDYLKTLRTGTFIPANAKLISTATNVHHLQELGIELENEIAYHNEIKQALESKKKTNDTDQGR